MRRLLIAAFLVLNLAPGASAAEETLRIEGIAFTESAAEEIRVQVWALGEQIAEHPEWQFEAVFEGVSAPGKAFSAGLGEARLPVLVELSAEGHGAVSLEVVLDEQRNLPPAWLRTGEAVSMTVSPGESSTEQVVVWGEISADSWRRYRRHWRPAVAHRLVAPGETLLLRPQFTGDRRLGTWLLFETASLPR
ncbi:MAG: hypothetical protein ACC742_06335 [Thermoanaerobaculales bacterium]